MREIWAKIIAFLAKLFGAKTPPEVTGADLNILHWWDIYRNKSDWLSYDFVTADGRKRNRKRFTIGMAKIACSEIAGLVLAENPEVDAGELVDQVIRAESLWDNLRKTSEYQAALGGQVLKVGIGKGRNGDAQISLDFIKAQNFIPLTWDNTSITEAAFVDRRSVGGKSLSRVETHKRANGSYIISNKAFDEATGQEVSLAAFGDEIEPEVTIAIDRPLFAYIRNPEANNIEPESPLGISIYANSMDTLQALDLAFDGMKTEILTGRQRVALPGLLMRPYLDENGEKRLGFDPTDEAYIRLEGDDADKMKPTDLSGQLRMDQWRSAIQTLLDVFSIQTGFSAGYFSFDGKAGVKTATEVISDNSKTFKTMQAFRENLDEGLKHIFAVINKLGIMYQIAGASTTAPNIAWNDGVIEDRNSRASYWTDLHNNKLVDRITALQHIHGISEEAAAKMSKAISDETATTSADMLFGGNGL